MNPDLLDRVPGARELEAWFGEWPTFHDAEILALHLERSAQSWLRLETRRRMEKHAVVTFFMADVFDLDLRGFNHQNVISGLGVEAIVSDSPFIAGPRRGWRISLIDCFGISGTIDADRIRIEFAPGAPGPPDAILPPCDDSSS